MLNEISRVNVDKKFLRAFMNIYFKMILVSPLFNENFFFTEIFNLNKKKEEIFFFTEKRKKLTYN